MTSSARRRLLGGGILAAWITSLGWLVLREAGGTAGGLDSPRRIAPGAEFYSIVLDGRLIGIAGITVDTAVTGLSIREVVRVELPGEDRRTTRHVLLSDAQLSRSLRLQRANANGRTPPSLFRLESRTWGDSLTTFRAGPGTGRPPLVGRLPLGGVTIPAAVPFRLVQVGGLKNGWSGEQVIADPVREAAETTTVRVVAESTFVVPDSAERDSLTGVWRLVHWDTVRAWRVEQGAVPEAHRAWIDARGWPVEEGYAFGPVQTRAVFEVVNAELGGPDRPIDSGGRAVPGALPLPLTQPPDSALDQVVIVVSRTDGPAWPGGALFFHGGRQAVRGDTVVIDRDAAEAPDRSSAMRPRNIGGLSAADPDPVLLQLKRALERYATVGDTLTRLVRWVARDVRLDTGPGGHDAPDSAARTRIASPQGKARLLVELARRAGIPARVVSGVVVTDPLLRSHTWVEAWRGHWRAVDPVFGHVPASAALLRVMDGPGRSLALVPRIGALDVTLITPSRGAAAR